LGALATARSPGPRVPTFGRPGRARRRRRVGCARLDPHLLAHAARAPDRRPIPLMSAPPRHPVRPHDVGASMRSESSGHVSTALSLRLLGRPGLEIDGAEGYRFRSRKSWAVLAFLLLSER